ncbi:hypothetical protein C9J22_11185 [Photobacterium phosphoreum]|nr:hypothetical protein C9J22_11185 [Photobacterium phosphoreum]
MLEFIIDSDEIRLFIKPETYVNQYIRYKTDGVFREDRVRLNFQKTDDKKKTKKSRVLKTRLFFLFNG